MQWGLHLWFRLDSKVPLEMNATPSPENQITVIGHKNPDTDAICAAIGQAQYLTQKGVAGVSAARCGEIPPRTAWVLEQAGIASPRLVEHVRPTAGFICERTPVTVCESETLQAAYICMRDGEMRSLPVVNSSNRVVGLVQFHHLLNLLMPPATDGYGVRRIKASLSNVALVLGAERLGGGQLFEEEEELIVLVGASSPQEVEARLKLARDEGLVGRFLVSCGDRPNILALAIEYAVRMIVVTGGNCLSDELKAKAEEAGIPVLISGHDTASTAMLLRCSRSVRSKMERDFISFDESTPLSVVKARVASTERQDLFPVHEEKSGKLIGVIGKSNLVDPPKPKIVLVDHNEFGQAVDGVEEAEIIQVLDHHRLGGDLCTREPIHVLNEPVGSTSTLVAREFFRDQMEIPAGVALCLAAGILSDTLNLTSPTTTPLDGEILRKLSAIAGVKADDFTRDFFAAGSPMKEGTVEDIIELDRKDFVELGWRLSISQVEELGFDGFEARRAEIEAGLNQKILSGNYDFACLLLTDISSHDSMLLVAGEEGISEKLIYPNLDATLHQAKGVVSRKKQLFPEVCNAIRQVGDRN